ncbi:MAG: DNA-directed RNA polymerase subunit K, partial [Candidatus Thorarchaeota archaeon]
RALQVSMGAPVLIDMKTAPKGRFGFAEAELKSGVLPMTVRRSLPTGETFDIPLSTLLANTRLD